MIPFPGESLAVYQVYEDGVNSNVWSDVWKREGSATLAAGTEWRAWIDTGVVDYLEAAEADIEVSWVVEVDSGSVTIEARESADPSYADETLVGSALGTFVATGPTTLVIPSGFTSADVLDNALGSLQVILTATAGSAAVSQVKMRVWPAGGPLGGFTEFPGFDTTPLNPSFISGGYIRGGSGTGSSSEESWDDADADLIANNATGPIEFGLGSYASDGDETDQHPVAAGAGFTGSGLIVGGGTVNTGMSHTAGVSVLTGPDWSTQSPISPSLVEGVDYIRPPEEVQEDYAAHAQQIGTGSTGWLNASAYVTSTAAEYPVGFATFNAEAVDEIDIPSGAYPKFIPDVSWGDSGTALTLPGSLGSATTTLPLPTSGRHIVVTLSHDAVTTSKEWPGNLATIFGGPLAGGGADARFGVGDPATTFDPIQAYAVMPPYLAWSPTAVVETVDPMQIIQRGDDLGMGVARIYDTGTRQNSIRIYGTV